MVATRDSHFLVLICCCDSVDLVDSYIHEHMGRNNRTWWVLKMLRSGHACSGESYVLEANHIFFMIKIHYMKP